MTAGEFTLTIVARGASSGQTFDGLVTAHERMVLRVAYRLLGCLEDAQDATQEVFLRLFRNLDRIGSDPQAWLYRVTVNVCHDQHRRRRIVVALDSMPQMADPAPDPERGIGRAHV